MNEKGSASRIANTAITVVLPPSGMTKSVEKRAREAPAKASETSSREITRMLYTISEALLWGFHKIIMSFVATSALYLFRDTFPTRLFFYPWMY